MITIVNIYIFKNLKIYFPLGFPGGSSDKKNPPVMQEMQKGWV